MCDCIWKLKSSKHGYIAILLAVLAPVVMAMFYLYIKESHSNINQTAVNLSTKEAALTAARNYYDGDLIQFGGQEQFLDRKATTAFNALMKSRVGLKNNVIPMKKTSVMYTTMDNQNGIIGFLLDCKKNDTREYDPDYEYIKPLSVVQRQGQDWYFDVKYAQRSNAAHGITNEYFIKDSSVKSGNILKIEKIDSDKIKASADVHLNTDGQGKTYRAEYIAKAPECDVDMVIGVPVNKNLGQKAKQISDALRAFVKSWLPVRGCAIGVIPYSGKVGVYAGTNYYNSSKATEEENQISIPISDSYKYYGADGSSLYAKNISKTHNGITGLMFNFDKFGKDGNLKDQLFELITPNTFTYAPLNVCYGGNVSVATGYCRENSKNYQYSCPMVGLSYDLLSVSKYLGLLNDGFNDSSSFLYLPIMFGISMLKDGGYTPPVLDGFSGIDHINDDDTKKVAIIIANQADRFEPHELTYFGYNNDASHVSMVEGDKLDFENGNVVHIGNGYLANTSVHNKHAKYYENARIKTTYNVTDKDHCEKGDVIIPTKQNMRFIVASLPFVKIHRLNGHFDEVEVNKVTSNSVVLEKEDYFQCFIPPGEDTELNISYSGNNPVLVKMEFFECEAREEPVGHYIRQDAEYVYICRKGTSASGSASIKMYQAKKVDDRWWALAYLGDHLLGRVEAPGDEGRHNSCEYNYELDAVKDITLKACNVQISSTALARYSLDVLQSAHIKNIINGESQRECLGYHGGNTHGDYCVGGSKVKSEAAGYLSSTYKGYAVSHYSNLEVKFARIKDNNRSENIRWDDNPPELTLYNNGKSVQSDITSESFRCYDILDAGTIKFTPQQKTGRAYCTACARNKDMEGNFGKARVTSSAIDVYYFVPTYRSLEVTAQASYRIGQSHEVLMRANHSMTYSSHYDDIQLVSYVGKADATNRDASYKLSKDRPITSCVKSITAKTIDEYVIREMKTIRAYPYARIYKTYSQGFCNSTITSIKAVNGGIVVENTGYFDCYLTSAEASFSVSLQKENSRNYGPAPGLAKMELYEADVLSCSRQVMQDQDYVYICGSDVGYGNFSISFVRINESEMIQHPPLAFVGNQLVFGEIVQKRDDPDVDLGYVSNVKVVVNACGTHSYKCEYEGNKTFEKKDARRRCTKSKYSSKYMIYPCREVNDNGVEYILPTMHYGLGQSYKISRYTKFAINYDFQDRGKGDKGHSEGVTGGDGNVTYWYMPYAYVYVDGKSAHMVNYDKIITYGSTIYDQNRAVKKDEGCKEVDNPNYFLGKTIQIKPNANDGTKYSCRHYKNTDWYGCFGYMDVTPYIEYVYEKEFLNCSADLRIEKTSALGSVESWGFSARRYHSYNDPDDIVDYRLSSYGTVDKKLLTLECKKPIFFKEPSITINKVTINRNVRYVTRKFRTVGRGNIQFIKGYSGPKKIYELEDGYTQIYIPKEHLTDTRLSFSVNNVFVSAIEWCNALDTKNSTYLERVKDATAATALKGSLCINYKVPNDTKYNVAHNLGVAPLFYLYSNNDRIFDVPYGSDFSLSIGDRCDIEEGVVSLVSQKYGYLNGVNRYFQGCFDEKGKINVKLTAKESVPAHFFMAEHTLPVNRILEACYGQKVNNGNVNETPTDIMRNKVAVDACKNFVQTFRNNGRLYIVKYLNPNDKNFKTESAAFDKLKTLNDDAVRIYEAISPEELKEVMNDILMDIENFAGYQGAKIVDKSS